jgi:uncharacterized protein DUF4406
MIVVYVAGPMSGVPEFNFPAFKEAEARLTEAGYSVISPVSKGKPSSGEYTDDRPYTWYLREDLKMLLEADAIALLPGSENSNGARLERYVAEKLDYAVGTVDEWCEGKIYAGSS